MDDRDDDDLDSMLRGVAAAPAEAPPFEAIGALIGRYRIARMLGTGGMGSVYEADDVDLGRRVAIKLVRVDVGDRRTTHERFVRERALTAELEHPNIMPIYDCGLSATGEPYYVMRVARGEPLDRRIARADTLDDRLALLPNMVAVVDAVAFAHSRGVVHRDLKPHNVLIGEFGETLVADWGLAKRVGQPGDGTLGTPAYMAPEQATGGIVDERADVYALGAMLYHVLANRAPPRERDLAPLTTSGAPVDVIAIATKALAIDPEARYHTAKELGDELRRFLAGQIVSARSYTRVELVRRWVGRHRSEVAIGATLGLVLAIVGAASVVRIVQERDAAEHARGNLSSRNDELILLQARAELTRDPTASLAWVARYPDNGPAWSTATAIATDAVSRTIAHDVWNLGRPVGSIAFSPDGRELVAGSFDGTLVVIDVATGTRRSFHADGGVGDRVVTSPDGAHVVTSDGRELVRLWDRTTGSSRLLAGDHVGGSTLAFSPDGTLVTATHANTRSTVWRVADGAPVTIGHGDGDLVALLPAGRAVVATKRDLAIIDVATNAVLQHTVVTAPPFDLEVAGAWIVATRFDALDLWNPQTGETRTMTPGVPTVALVATSRDGRYVMTCGHFGRQIWLFDLAAQTSGLVSGDERCFRQGFTFSPDGAMFATMGLGGEVRLHMLPEHSMRRLLGHDGVVTDLAFSPDGRWLASSGSDHTVRLWPLDFGDMRTFHETWTLDRVAADGHLLARGEGGPEVIDTRTGNKVALPDPPAHLFDGCISRDGSTVALYGTDRAIAVYDLHTGTHRRLPPLADLAVNDDSPTGCSSRGDRIAQIDNRGVVRVVDLATGAIRTIATLGDGGIGMMFSHDDRALAVTSRDGLVIAIDPDTGAKRGAMTFPSLAWSVNWSADDRQLVAPCDDGVVRVLDLATNSVRAFRGHVGSVAGAAFTADGRRIVSSGVDATIRLWDLATGAGIVVRREPSSISSLNFVGTSPLLVYRCRDLGLVRAWDTRSMPSFEISPAALHAWTRNVTTAEVDGAGTLASPIR